MWEDMKSGSKWVIVNTCYFPSDLPENVGRPSTPESNEVLYLAYIILCVFMFCKLFYSPSVYPFIGVIPDTTLLICRQIFSDFNFKILF